MRNQIGHKEIDAIRKFAALFVSDEPISTEVISSARKILDTRRQEAAEYGLTDADVIRALLRPVFRRKKGCDCYTCKARREDTKKNQIESFQQTYVNAG